MAAELNHNLKSLPSDVINVILQYVPSPFKNAIKDAKFKMDLKKVKLLHAPRMVGLVSLQYHERRENMFANLNCYTKQELKQMLADNKIKGRSKVKSREEMIKIIMSY